MDIWKPLISDTAYHFIVGFIKIAGYVKQLGRKTPRNFYMNLCETSEYVIRDFFKHSFSWKLFTCVLAVGKGDGNHVKK